MIEKKYPYLITYLQQTIFRCRKARWVVVMLLTMVLCGDMGRGQIRTPSDMSNTGGQGGGAAVVAWNGVSSHYGIGYGHLVPIVADDYCRKLLGAAVVIQDKSLSVLKANNCLDKRRGTKRYWWFLGHAASTDAHKVFAGISLDKPWSTKPDLYGPDEMSHDCRAEVVVISACNSALQRAEEMRELLDAKVWVGWTCESSAMFMAKSGRMWPNYSDGMKTASQVKAIQVDKWRWLNETDIKVLGNKQFVLDITP